VLRIDPIALPQVPRATLPAGAPVVLTPREVRLVIEQLRGVPRLVVNLLYGSGLRLQECLGLRVKDLDFERSEVTVRRGKGQKDRKVMLPQVVKTELAEHLEQVRRQHAADLAAGLGSGRIAGSPIA
jgi:integrase